MASDAPRRPASWSWGIAILAVLGAIGGWTAWRLQLHGVDEAITRKRAALKQLQLKGVPPDPEVVEYLQSRGLVFGTQYEDQLARLAPSLPAPEGHTNAQLYFQERVHDVQQTLEHLATAQGMELPAVLGLPKELPPVDAVPRFLAQLGLIEDTATLLSAVDGIALVRSFKVEDPQPVPPAATEGAELFLSAVPVRIRLTCSLRAVSRLLGALDRAVPLMDLLAVRIVTVPPAVEDPEAPPAAAVLDAEIVVARYQVTAPETEPAAEEAPAAPASRSKRPAS